MFTGLVQAVGSVREVIVQPPGKRLAIYAPEMSRQAIVGDSIAINGCCLTVVANEAGCLTFEVGPETLAKTNLGVLRADSRVNLEPSLRVGDRLGGHYVTGHIEALGLLATRDDRHEWSTFWFSHPPALGRFMVAKGSIAVDGVSLTLVEVEEHRFSVALIPHTLAATTLGGLELGDSVNLETDLLAKYAQKQLTDTP